MLERVRLLRPLRHRDFGLLWAGMSISIVGDGFYDCFYDQTLVLTGVLGSAIFAGFLFLPGLRDPEQAE